MQYNPAKSFYYLPLILASPLTFIISPSKEERSEDFPDPTIPTTATKHPSGTFHVISRSVDSMISWFGLSSHEKDAFFNSIGDSFFSSWQIYKIVMLHDSWNQISQFHEKIFLNIFRNIHNKIWKISVKLIHFIWRVLRNDGLFFLYFSIYWSIIFMKNIKNSFREIDLFDFMNFFGMDFLKFSGLLCA